MYRVTEKYQDMAGKWRVRVQVGDTETAFFKFQNEPSETEIDAEAGKFLQARVDAKDLEAAKTEKDFALFTAENNLIEYYRSLEVPDKVTEPVSEVISPPIGKGGEVVEPVQIETSTTVFKLIYEVIRNGGTLENIKYHSNLMGPVPVETPVEPLVEDLVESPIEISVEISGKSSSSSITTENKSEESMLPETPRP